MTKPGQNTEDSGLTLWGRRNSSNVQKILWCLTMLGLSARRVDIGGPFGGLDMPDFRSMNPNEQIPVMRDGPIFLWESNAILRYLARRQNETNLYPTRHDEAYMVDRWLDWQLSTLTPVEAPLFRELIRTTEPSRNHGLVRELSTALVQRWHIVERHLAGRSFLETGRTTLAELALGPFVHRYFNLPISRPETPNLRRWYDALREIKGYDWVDQPLT
jgi:glutathione S-transferase